MIVLEILQRTDQYIAVEAMISRKHEETHKRPW